MKNQIKREQCVESGLRTKYLRIGFIIIQIIIAAVLLISAVRFSAAEPVTIDLKRFESDYIGYNGVVWNVGDGELQDSNIVLIKGPYQYLEAGSYTIGIDYETDKEQFCEIISQSRPDAVEANRFRLNRNKHHVEYDFRIKREVKDLEFRITGYSGGYFSLSSVSLSVNGRQWLALLSIWVIFSFFADALIFVERIRSCRETIAFIIGIALVSSLILFMRGINGGHDYEFHLLRIESIAEGLRSGVFPVRMDMAFNDGFGYPVSVFYGDALLYIPALLRIAGFSVTEAYKLYIFLVNMLTAAASYWCFRRITAHKYIALTAALVYLTSSYRLVDIFVRASVGEYTSFIFFPVIAGAMWSIYNDKDYQSCGSNQIGGSAKIDNDIQKDGGMRTKSWSPDIKNAVILAAGMSGLVYTHILSTEITGIVLIIFALAAFRKTFRRNTLVTLLLAGMLFLVISAAFLVPFMDYYLNTETLIKLTTRMTRRIQSSGADIVDFFAFFKNCFGWDNVNIRERLQLTPGLVQMGTLCAAVCAWISGNADRRIKALSVLSIVLLFISSSAFPWNYLAEHIPFGNFIAQVQFPWRYIAPASMVLSMLFAYLTDLAFEKGIISVKDISACAAVCFAMTGFFASTYLNNAYQLNYIDTAEIQQYTGFFEGAMNGTEYLLPGVDTEVLDSTVIGYGTEVISVSEDGTDMILTIGSSEDEPAVLIPRFNYPNYRISDSSGNELAIATGFNGAIVCFPKDCYEGEIFVRYKEPVSWRIAGLLSALGCIFSLFVLVKKRKRRISINEE